MIRIKAYCEAENIDTAYQLLIENRRNIILGGGCFLNLQNKRVNTAISLKKACLNSIEITENGIRIGSELSLENVADSNIIRKYLDGVLSKAIKSISGPQLRNTAQIGASVYSKFGFSDIMTVLLACDAKLEFYKLGEVTVEEYLNMKVPRDILMYVNLPNVDSGEAEYFNSRLSTVDFPTLNFAVVKNSGLHRVAVGARPRKAKRIPRLEWYLDNNELMDENDEELFRELELGHNMKGSKETRIRVVKKFVEDYYSR